MDWGHLVVNLVEANKILGLGRGGVGRSPRNGVRKKCMCESIGGCRDGE